MQITNYDNCDFLIISALLLPPLRSNCSPGIGLI
jgi:hypothetical protein